MNNLLWFYFGVLSLGLVMVWILLLWQRRNYAKLNVDILSQIPTQNSNLQDVHAGNIDPSSSGSSGGNSLIQQESDLLERYRRLETLLDEKNRELEKAQKALANEVERQEAFTKIKDLLEKEIAGLKAKNHQLLAQLNILTEIPKDSVTSPEIIP